MKRLILLALGALFAMVLAAPAATAAGPYTNTVNYTGQGLTADGFGGYDLNTELCGLANGADADGPYLLFVLTANGAKNADITGPWGTVAMTKFGNGTFKYISGWFDPSTLPGHVTATYDGKVKNVQLTISHGCRPYTSGAWCSPGFWKNADDAAWTLTGKAKTDLFNTTVVPNFYDTTFVADPTLYTTLSETAYKSGQLASGPFGLTPFNATGAFLTNNIPGFQFDYDLFVAAQNTGETTYMCPIDSHGNFKQ
jgi:hypothetical protein